MARVLAYRSASADKEDTAWLGMVLFLASWAMLFAGILFAYYLLRARSPMWPPAGVELPVAWPLINTLVLAASSATLHTAVRAVRGGATSVAAARWIGASVGLGVAFLALQILLWRSVWETGVRPQSNLYGSVFYGITLFHALHVVAGIGVLGWIWRLARGGAFHPGRFAPLRVGAMFWHFVDAVWVVVFVTVYVI